jgi:uncharacterized protein with HEPN domain
MPRDEDLAADILIAAQFLDGWLHGQTIEALNERLLLSAVTRELIIIGEAAAHLSPAFKAHVPDVPWPDVVNMRNILVHSYNRVDKNIVWTSAVRDVPELARAITAALDAES